ncbi:MAG: GTP cyclohydrolase I FolE [Gammaproteobacteria bacterium]
MPTNERRQSVDVPALADHLRKALSTLGEDPAREGLTTTPERAARALAFLTRGYEQKLEDIVHNALFTTANDEMVILKDIEMFSLCEHHMLPFFGRVHIGYLPDGKVIGVSKMARIVDLYARRLQIQEQLTQQIAQAVLEVTNARGVGVLIEAQHLCMIMRGVEKQNSVMKTSMMLGLFRSNGATRGEFLSMLQG